MLLLGAYFLLSAIVIPNIAGSLSKDFGDLTMSSPQSIIAVIVMVIVLVIIGVFLSKKSKSLLE
jgi:predicted transporter